MYGPIVSRWEIGGALVLLCCLQMASIYSIYTYTHFIYCCPGVKPFNCFQLRIWNTMHNWDSFACTTGCPRLQHHNLVQLLQSLQNASKYSVCFLPNGSFSLKFSPNRHGSDGNKVMLDDFYRKYLHYQQSIGRLDCESKYQPKTCTRIQR